METSLGYLLVVQMVLQMALRTECCSVQLMEKHLELPMARLKAMSLVCSSAEQMVMQKVLMMEKDWEQRRDLSLVQLTGLLKEMRLDRLSAEQMVMQTVLMMEMGLGWQTETS
eukprot:scaffold8566_cov107-Skeletonema_marinoi.AAC.2